MELPTAVQEQLDKVLAAKKAEETPVVEASPKQPEMTVEQPIEENPAEEQPISEEIPLPEPQGVAEPTALTRQADRQNVQYPVQTQSQHDDWQHKYSVLQGMFRKQGEQIKQLSEQVHALEDENGSLKEQAKKSVQSLSVTDADVEKYYTAEDIEEYGIDYCRRNLERTLRIQRDTAPKQPEKNADIERIKAELEAQKEQAFYDSLDSLVPGWEKINQSQEWLTFLKTVQPEIGVTYDAILTDAVNRRDAHRVSLLFKKFTDAQKSCSPMSQQVVPRPSGNATQPQSDDSISYEEWINRMNSLPSRGLSSDALYREEAKLRKMMAEGKVRSGKAPATSQRVGFI